MRKTLKWTAIILLIAVVGAVGWIVWKWYNVKNVSVDAFSLIPADAIYCVAVANPIESWKEITESDTWGHLQSNSYFASLTESVNDLDSVIRQNDLLFNLIGDRSLVASAHMTGAKAYDFLFLIDLKGASGIKFINEYLSEFSLTGYSVRKEKYYEDDIIVLHNKAAKSDLYVSQPGTYLLASFNKKIITAALDAQQNDQANAREAFVRTAGELKSGGILQLYLNYAMLPQFMSCYADGTNEYVQRLAQTLQTSGLNVELEEGLIRATGNTYVNDSVESYLKTLAISGAGPTEFAEIAPQRTAFCMSFGFSSFSEFFENFEKNIQQDVKEYDTYRANLKQVEDYLKIDLQENFIDWIGDEAALLEMQSAGQGSDNEMALILKADNIEKARTGLAHVEKMVRRRTPVKFKTVEHRGYAINYLSMKGLFNILLGKFFARYDKPYYTIINNFIIFSNHPQTLESIIDDYLEKNTLVKSEEFRDFRKKFDDEGAVFVYINTPVLFNTMKKLADYKTRNSMEQNKEYIVCFRQAGFQLVPDEGAFKTILAEQFVGPERPAPVLAQVTPAPEVQQDTSESVSEERAEEVNILPEESDPMTLPYIYVQDLNASSYTAYFSDSTTVHYEVDLKNGFKNGSFTEYYPNGEVKMTGRFKDDKQDGVWRLYDENRKLVMKRTYDEGVVKKEK